MHDERTGVLLRQTENIRGHGGDGKTFKVMTST